jgi:hypothetical protein
MIAIIEGMLKLARLVPSIDTVTISQPSAGVHGH